MTNEELLEEIWQEYLDTADLVKLANAQRSKAADRGANLLHYHRRASDLRASLDVLESRYNNLHREIERSKS